MMSISKESRVRCSGSRSTLSVVAARRPRSPTQGPNPAHPNHSPLVPRYDQCYNRQKLKQDHLRRRMLKDRPQNGLAKRRVKRESQLSYHLRRRSRGQDPLGRVGLQDLVLIGAPDGGHDERSNSGHGGLVLVRRVSGVVATAGRPWPLPPGPSIWDRPGG